MTRLALDLGGTSLRLGLGDGRGHWLRSRSIAQPADGGAAAVVAAVSETLAGWGVAPCDLDGIGVSVAALVDEEGNVRRAENLGWTDVPLGQELSVAFGCRALVETDVFCGARFEAAEGHARGAVAALYVALGTGIGHAFVFRGRVWRGSAGNANAFGHLVVDPVGAPCYCGNAGCLCLLAGGKAQASDAAPEGALEALALSLGRAVTLIEPEVIILAGGALSQRWFDLSRLTDALGATFYPGARMPSVVLSHVADSNLRGAALLLETNDDDT